MTKKTLKIIDDTLKEIKALDTKILNLKKINSFTDVLLITSGSSSTHMSAISNKLIRALKKNKVEILWASVREPYNYIQAKQLGCQIITMPPKIIEKVSNFGKSFDRLTKDTVIAFLKDSRKSRFRI